jgi:thymidylate synthase (FAD)
MIGRQLKVLDDGFIRVVDYMGNDSAIVQAARVSYGAGTRQVSTDRGLIRFLMRHGHTTPFEMCEIKLHVRVPMDTWRQWIRHRTASVNEYSTRYSLAIDSMQTTLPHEWRTQAAENRQGSQGTLGPDVGAELSTAEQHLHNLATRTYKGRIAAGVAREQARKDLPLSTYTEAYWKINLHNLLHFLELRMDAHAQQEIREYATLLGSKVVSKWVPITWEAFRDYRLQGVNLSRAEREIVKALAEKRMRKAQAIARAHGLLNKDESGKLMASRERRELEQKLVSMGLVAPWTPSVR